jgi:hypothetical protein
VHVLVWHKVLTRMSPVGQMPEARLLTFVIAQAINEEGPDVAAWNAWAERAGRADRREPFTGGFWDRGFVAYCRSVGLNPSQVLGMVREAAYAETRMLEARDVADCTEDELRAIRHEIRTGVQAPDHNRAGRIGAPGERSAP